MTKDDALVFWNGENVVDNANGSPTMILYFAAIDLFRFNQKHTFWLDLPKCSSRARYSGLKVIHMITGKFSKREKSLSVLNGPWMQTKPGINNFSKDYSLPCDSKVHIALMYSRKKHLSWGRVETLS